MKYVKSTDVLEHIKKNLNKNNYLSIFTAGSMPDVMSPMTDLDIYIVTDNKSYAKLLDNIVNIMDNLMKKEKSITYSFYRGPVKYKYKGLVHFLIYTKEKIPGFPRVSFYEENMPVLTQLKDNAKVVAGLHPRILLEGFDLAEEKSNSITLKRWKGKYQNLIKNNRINHPEWKKVNGKWEFSRTYKSPSNFLREELIHYYKKHNLDK